MKRPAEAFLGLILALRAAFWSVAFLLLWAWLATLARPFDVRLAFTFPEWVRPLGWALAVPAGLLTLWCITTFAARGRGTPAPFDPPREFVAVGPYRFVRNPMYVGGFGVLLGAGLIVRSPSIAGLAVLFLLIAHVFVRLYEEPALERRFGGPYRRYRSSVSRWIVKAPGRVTGRA